MSSERPMDLSDAFEFVVFIVACGWFVFPVIWIGELCALLNRCSRVVRNSPCRRCGSKALQDYGDGCPICGTVDYSRQWVR